MPAFLLPDLGEGLTEAEIVTWHVKAGDTVTVDQGIVEVETDSLNRASSRPRPAPTMPTRAATFSSATARPARAVVVTGPPGHRPQSRRLAPRRPLPRGRATAPFRRS
jgi:hypothetical protein